MRTILVVDGNRRLAELMGQLLDDDQRFRVVAVVGTPAAALAAAAAHAPDVVLVSEVLDGGLGSATCAALRSVVPDAALLLWSHHPSAAPSQSPEVDGVLERGMSYHELAQAVRHARRTVRRAVGLDGRGARASC